MLSRLRNAVAPLRRALAAPLVRRGIQADTVTLAAIPLSLGAALFIIEGRTPCGFLLALAAVLADFVDGEVARMQQRTTPFGDCLDAVVDRVVEGALLAALALRWPLPAACAIALGGLVSYIKARVGLVIASDNRDWPGVGDRTDRVVLILLAIALGPSSAAPRVLWGLVALSAVGALQRLAHARVLIEKGPSERPPNGPRRG